MIYPLADYWRDWVAENPFLTHDLRRWRKRGYDWKLPLACAGLPALALLLLHGLFAVFPPPPGSFFGDRTGMLALSFVSLVHFGAAVHFASQTFSLAKEATADRIEFIRLLPQSRRELMAKLGLARAVLRLPAALLALPVYLVILTYGGVEVADVAGLYVLYGLMLFAPPGLGEVNGALTARRGTAANPQQQRAAGAGGPIASGLFLIQVLLQLFAGPLLGPVIRILGGRLAGVVGPKVGWLLPISALVAMGRLLVLVQPFYRGWLMPILPLGLYWLLRSVTRVHVFAELFSREPVLHSQSGGRQVHVLPEVSGRPEEQQLNRRLEAVYTSVLYLTLVGLCWRPMVLNGVLGAAVGSPTASGGVAALLVVLAGWNVLGIFERLRNTLDVYQVGASAWSDAVAHTVRMVVRITALLLGACLLGWVLPWPEPALTLGLVLAALAAMLVFGLGWRAAVNRRWEIAQRKEAQTNTAGDIAWLLLWLATYVAPLAIVARGAPYALHLVAACSPVYGLLRLLPGIWRDPSPVPVPLALLLPALTGAVPFVLSPRRGSVAARVEQARTRRDPLDGAARRLAERLDNPFLTLAVSRLGRGPVGLTVRVAAGLLLALGLPIGLIFVIFSGISSGRGTPVWELLAQPAGSTGWQIGGIAFSIFSGLVVLFANASASTNAATSIRSESTAARQQGRMPFLLISGISDQGIAAGLLATVSLVFLPLFAAGLGGSFVLLLAALAYGAAWWVVPAWAWLVWVTGSGAVLTSLGAFGDWRLRTGWRRLLWVALKVVPVVGIMVGLGYGLIRIGPWLFVNVPQLLPWLPVLAAAAALTNALMLPWRWKAAVAAVHSTRVEEDLERPK